MEDHNSQEAVAKRASQEDPIVMYLVVHETLGMSVGKMCAQCGHAVGMLDRKYREVNLEIESHIDPIYGPPEGFWENYPQEIKDRIKIWDEWDETSFRKVTLRADDKEWAKLKEEIPETHRVVVVDAGLTEIPSGSETVIGVWPMRKSQRPKILTKLQALK